MQFFTSPEDLRGWVKSCPSADVAATKLMSLFPQQPDIKENESIVETCREMCKEDKDGNASKVLFGVLAKHNITEMKVQGAKGANMMNKTAQPAPASRQRNDWVRGNRNKWNRVVDGFNEGTPWRIDRDKFYNFTHYYTDDLRFDEDPTHVYSGEAIWRMYIMDKFTSDYQDEKGRVVGGYINDRFHRFPTAGTPANPDVDRLHGNQMELAPGERSRKPRPHQYNMERRLEEARGNKLEDLEAVVANAKDVIKLSSVQPKEKDSDKVYNIFKDTIDMREAGIEYSKMIGAISDHYGVSILGVTQIDRAAQQLKAKHDGIVYVSNGSSSMTVSADGSGRVLQVGNEMVSVKLGNGQTLTLQPGTLFSQIQDSLCKIEEDPTGTLNQNTKILVENIDALKAEAKVLDINEGMQELEGETSSVAPVPGSTLASPTEAVAPVASENSAMSDFSVNEVPQ